MTTKQVINLCIQTQTPVLLWGDPGIGKTSFMYQYAEKMGVDLEVLIGATRAPEDISGFPLAKDDVVKFTQPSWVARLKKNGGIIFLDELSCAAPAMQHAMLRVAAERVVGDVKLENVAVVAAANPVDVAAFGWNLSAPLANRFVHIDWPVSASEWIDGTLGYWKWEELPKLPKDWEERRSEQAVLVTSFLKAHPMHLLKVPKTEVEAGKAWPSPRSWTMAITLMTACKAVGAASEDEYKLLFGCVGEGPGLEFLNWKKGLRLPNPEDLLNNPDSLNTAVKDDELFVISQAVCTACLEKFDKDRWKAAWKVFGLIVDADKTDVVFPAARRLALGNDMDIPNNVLTKFLPVFKAAGMLGGI